MAHIRIDWLHRTIVVEAKNYDDKIDDAIFTRLCYIIENYFRDTSSLGIFYTRKGATGFPARAQSDEEQRRKRSLTYAQATQIIFYARTNKRIIVFDHDDIISLRNPGSLPKMLELKIKSIGEWTGMPDANVENVQVIDLPPHLARHMHGGTDA